LSKLLNKKIGANIVHSNIPFSYNAKKLIKDNIISSSNLLEGGDDYELIFTSPPKNDNKIIKIAKIKNYKVSKVGRIIGKNGIFMDGKKISNHVHSFKYSF